MTDGEAALEEIERCSRAGLKGIGELRPTKSAFSRTHRSALDSVVAAAQEHHLIFLFHVSEPVGHLYAGKGNSYPNVVYPFIVRYHEVPVVLAHWGGGLLFYSLMPKVTQALKNVYFDTAASPFLYRADIFRYAVELVGAEKILFGSDFPLMPYRRALGAVHEAPLTAEEKELVLGRNAQRLLSWEG